MPDYFAMYQCLFNAQTQAIEILQKAQQDPEELYINAPAPIIVLLNKRVNAQSDAQKGDKQ